MAKKAVAQKEPVKVREKKLANGNVSLYLGFTTTAAITVFMKTVVRERRIPFEIKAAGKDEINAIIKEVRDAR